MDDRLRDDITDVTDATDAADMTGLTDVTDIPGMTDVTDADGLAEFYERSQGEVSYVDFTAEPEGVAGAPAATANQEFPTASAPATPTAAGWLIEAIPEGTDAGVPSSISPGARAERRRPYGHTVSIGQLYRESIRKRVKRRRSSAFKFLAACFGGAVVGGTLVFVGIVLLWPAVATRFFSYAPANGHTGRAEADNPIEFSYVRGRVNTGIGYSEEFNENYDYYKEQYPDLPKGVYVQSVELLSGAFLAGVQTGDIITEFNGQAMEHYNDMLAILDGLKPGSTVPLKVYRDGETLAFDVELSEDTGE